MTAQLACSAILFDLDGVLVHSADSVHRSWAAWAATHGIALSKVLAAARGQRSVDTIRTVAPELDAAAEAAALEADQALDVAEVTAGPGAAALLGSLADDDWAVVTSGTQHLARARLRAAGLPEPTVLVTAEDVQHGKPDPAGYLLAARRLGSPAQECVVIEDAAAGVQAGQRAGMPVIGLHNGSDARHLAPANVVAQSCVDIAIRRDMSGNVLLVTISGADTR